MAAIIIGMCIVLLPFLLEELAVISPAYEFTMDQVRLLPRMVHFPPGLTKLVLVLATLSSLTMPGILSSGIASPTPRKGSS